MSNDNPIIAPDTDNLDDFTRLLEGKAIPAEVVEDNHQEDNQDSGTVEPATEIEAFEEPDVEEEVVDDLPEDDSVLKIKKKQTFQERINELTAKAREAERREAEEATARRALEQKLDEVVARLNKEAPKEEPAFAGPRPDELDDKGELKYALGEFDPEYIRDLTKYTIAEETRFVREQEAKQREAAIQQQAQTALETEWANKLSEAEKAMPDLREKGQNLVSTFDGLEPAYGQYLANTLMSLDNGPEVLYYLSDNPAEAQKIVAAGAVNATIMLGRIDAIVSKPKATPKKVSDAPEPPQVRARGAGGKFDVADDTDDLTAFERKFFS